jgi:[protein-PII] uridylyltransferase
MRQVKTNVLEALGVHAEEHAEEEEEQDRGSRMQDPGELGIPQIADVPPTDPSALNAQPLTPSLLSTLNSAWLDSHLRAFSAYYLTVTPPERIAADLQIIHTLRPDDIHVSGAWDASTGTVEYRVITRNPVAVNGCFHRICGVMTAKRLEIISADINTTHDGVVVDTFRVLDTDFSGAIPDHRIEEVSELIIRVLKREESIEDLFKRSRRFGSDHSIPAVSNLPTRVSIDTESSDSRTVVDVFAHDRPGLLYRIARTLHELNVSIDLAKIATHFDQVVDVFYLTEQDGRKITDEQRLEEIRNTLLARLD